MNDSAPHGVILSPNNAHGLQAGRNGFPRRLYIIHKDRSA